MKMSSPVGVLLNGAWQEKSRRGVLGHGGQSTQALSDGIKGKVSFERHRERTGHMGGLLADGIQQKGFVNILEAVIGGGAYSLVSFAGGGKCLFSAIYGRSERVGFLFSSEVHWLAPKHQKCV